MKFTIEQRSWFKKIISRTLEYVFRSCDVRVQFIAHFEHVALKAMSDLLTVTWYNAKSVLRAYVQGL
jgi:hypothetical protein